MIARFFATSFKAKRNNTAQPKGKIPNIRRNNPFVSGTARALRIPAGAKEKTRNQTKNNTIPFHKKSLVIPIFSAIIILLYRKIELIFLKIYFQISFVNKKIEVKR